MGVYKLLVKYGNSPAPLLDLGELGFEVDTGKLFVGNGTSNILIGDSESGGIAEKLATAREIRLAGDATGITMFDGSANVVIDTLVNIDKSKVQGLGTTVNYNTGTTAGHVPLIGEDGKLPSNIMPTITITKTWVVNDQSDLIELSEATMGDFAIVKNILIGDSFYFLEADPYSNIDNWEHINIGLSAVSSVNGQTGTVVIENITGNAATSSRLEDERTIAVNLDSRDVNFFDGSENFSTGVQGQLPRDYMQLMGARTVLGNASSSDATPSAIGGRENGMIIYTASPTTTTISANDVFLIQRNNNTNKVSYETIKNNIGSKPYLDVTSITSQYTINTNNFRAVLLPTEYNLSTLPMYKLLLYGSIVLLENITVNNSTPIELIRLTINGINSSLVVEPYTGNFKYRTNGQGNYSATIRGWTLTSPTTQRLDIYINTFSTSINLATNDVIYI